MIVSPSRFAEKLKKHTHTHKRTQYNLHLTILNCWRKTFFRKRNKFSPICDLFADANVWRDSVTLVTLPCATPCAALRLAHLQVRLDWEFLGFLQKSRLVIYSILPRVYLFWTFSIIFSICQDSACGSEELGHTRVRARDSWTSRVSTTGSRGLEKITPPGKIKCMLLKEKKIKTRRQ